MKLLHFLAVFGLALSGCVGDDTCSCPAQFYFGETGTISSPNYPNNYCNSMKCTYTITVRTGTFLKLQFTAMNVEAGNDLVQIYDSNKADDNYNKMATISGTTVPSQAFYSGTNQITVTFTTDGSKVYTGWSASYSSVSNICGATALTPGYGGSGSIASPDWGYMYPDNVDCFWTITAPSSQRLRLTFDANSQTEANADFVVVRYDNQEISFTGNNFQTVETVGNSMTVEFTSDDTVINNGFRATYQAFTPTQDCSCGTSSRVLSTPNGNLQVASPNFNHGGTSHNYCNNANCTWFLQVPNGYNVAITFNEFDLERNYDNVYMYQGVFGPRIASCTGSSCANRTSNTNQMTLQFVTDISVSGQGFLSTFYAVPSL